MVKAFVFGKFLPFHKGHQAMIDFALTHCDILTVLVCCSDKETIPSEVREKWIIDTYKQNSKVSVVAYNYREEDLPNTSESSQDVSEIWSQIFKELLPDYTLLITSEPYGNYVASYMGIRHLSFDHSRTNYPVSATAIRNNLFDNWSYLPLAVKPYFLKKIVILGTESTGKTTLTEKLAAYFGAAKVLETARDIIQDSKAFKFDDLYRVAQEHANKIAACPIEASPLLFIDTDVHITNSYARFMYGKELKLSREVKEINKATLYLYLNHDVSYVQDGTRLSEVDRNQLDQSHRQTLHHYGIKYHEIKGDWQERFKQAVDVIKSQLGIPSDHLQSL